MTIQQPRPMSFCLQSMHVVLGFFVFPCREFSCLGHRQGLFR
uniref:Uncharacterized protein n=1 Tax=Anguilla anguilla TaxID=7936 RepID=A0A0E9S9B4_ANGAN